MTTKTVRIEVELTDDQAWEFAQFLKRVSFAEYRANAEGQDQAYAMVAAGNEIQAALARAGYAPR